VDRNGVWAGRAHDVWTDAHDLTSVGDSAFEWMLGHRSTLPGPELAHPRTRAAAAAHMMKAAQVSDKVTAVARTTRARPSRR
jgi:hypothetical protein